MSWFKKSRGHATPNSNSSLLPKGYKSTSPKSTDTDTNICIDVFRNHWKQVWNVLQLVHTGNNLLEQIETVLHNTEQMINFIATEKPDSGCPGLVLTYVMEHGVLEKLGVWCSSVSSEYREYILREQLKYYEMLISQSQQLILIYKPIVNPLLDLMVSASDYLDKCRSPDVQRHLVLLLHQLCVSISQQSFILDNFFQDGGAEDLPKFLVFSLLFPYIHSEQMIGQQARDGLLLIMALSARNNDVGQFIALNSDFCPVLATGLSGLYSGLPGKLTFLAENEWGCLTDDDCNAIPELHMFINSLQFCNAVAQVAHHMVRDQLIAYITSGFLEPVVGPALHQNSRDEIATATAYLELFLRKITEPSLLKAFLKFIISSKYDEVFILDSLIDRINSSTILSLMSLTLFKTILDLNCEDVLYQLVLKYLIPCSHVMVSQRQSINKQDIYSRSARKFLCLRPTCCSVLNQTAASDNTNSSIPALNTSFQSEDCFSLDGSVPNGGLFDNSYLDYLEDAQCRIRNCALACRKWSAPYNGKNPPYNRTFSNQSEHPNSSKSRRSQQSFLNNSLQLSPIAHDKEALAINIYDNVYSTGAHNESELEFSSDCSNFNKTMHLAEPTQETNNTNNCDTNTDTQVPSNCLSQAELGNVVVEGSLTDRNKAETVFSLMEYLDSVTVEAVHGQISVVSLADIESSFDELSTLLSLSSGIADSDSSKCNKRTETHSPGVVEKLMKYGDESTYIDITTLDDDKYRSFRTVNSNKFYHLCIDQQESTDFDGNHLNFEDSVDFNENSDVHQNVKYDGSSLSNDNKMADLLVEQIIKETTLAPVKPLQIRIDESFMPPSMSSALQETSLSGSSPTKHEQPSIGPFLTSLFSRLESMMQNSLLMNLILTDLIARLACYPQPLLRSFLLSHNLVFQPSIKSLVQVLASVRQKVDSYLGSLSGIDQLMVQARNALVWQEHQYLMSCDHNHRSSDTDSLPGKGVTSHRPKKSISLADLHSKTSEKSKTSFTHRFFRKSSSKSRRRSSKDSNISTELIPTDQGYQFKKTTLLGKDNMATVESQATVNAVYCAIVLEEFMKELAALSQEHSVLSLDDGYHKFGVGQHPSNAHFPEGSIVWVMV